MVTTSVFNLGPLKTEEKARSSSSTIKPPKPLLVVYPSEPDEYPLLIFFHGFSLHNVNYRELFRHIASHGYIVVAPQMYNIPACDAKQEIADAVELTEWLPTGLEYYLPRNVCAAFEKMVVAGHSRGGKVAFGAALGRVTTSFLKYSAIIGVDPVDGLDSSTQIPPPILTHKAHSLEQGIPVLVIGSGLPNQRMSPDGMNHRNFFEECSASAYHFVVKTCRHMDFLDDNFVIESVASMIGEPCQDRKTKRKIRSFAGGIMVAFLNACVKNDYGDLEAVLQDPSIAPVEIEPPQVYLEEKKKAGMLSRL